MEEADGIVILSLKQIGWYAAGSRVVHANLFLF